MPMCTYIDDLQKQNMKKIEDPEINEYIAKISKVLDEEILITEQKDYETRLFRKPKLNTSYCIYYNTVSIEYQVLSFATKGELIWYCIGILTGNDMLSHTRKIDLTI